MSPVNDRSQPDTVHTRMCLGIFVIKSFANPCSCPFLSRWMPVDEATVEEDRWNDGHIRSTSSGPLYWQPSGREGAKGMSLNQVLEDVSMWWWRYGGTCVYHKTQINSRLFFSFSPATAYNWLKLFSKCIYVNGFYMTARQSIRMQENCFTTSRQH